MGGPPICPTGARPGAPGHRTPSLARSTLPVLARTSGERSLPPAHAAEQGDVEALVRLADATSAVAAKQLSLRRSGRPVMIRGPDDNRNQHISDDVLRGTKAGASGSVATILSSGADLRSGDRRAKRLLGGVSSSLPREGLR
jgi:hypothetical protein